MTYLRVVVKRRPAVTGVIAIQSALAYVSTLTTLLPQSAHTQRSVRVRVGVRFRVKVIVEVRV